MLVKEMHIEFGLGLQKLNALSRRKFYGEEIDVLLNRAVEQFTRDSIRMEEDEHGFESREIDVDRIRPLITKVQLPAEFQEATTDYREYLVHLPSDYAYLVGDNWYQAENCSSKLTTTAVPRYYYRIPVIGTATLTPPYYAIANLKIATDAYVNLVTDTQQGTGADIYTGYASKEKFPVVRLMQEVFSQKKRNAAFSAGATLAGGNIIHGLYYERYGTLNFPGEFIVVTSATGTNHIVLDGVDTSIASSVSIPYNQQSSTDTYGIVTSRLVRSSKVDNILHTKYYMPLEDSPVSVIESNLVRLFSHTNRIVNRSSITYIRQPQKIDLLLQRNCELAPEFHRKVVDLAIDYAAGHIEAQVLKQITNDEKQRN